MADITADGTTGYPTVLDTRTTLTDGASGSDQLAAQVNGPAAAVLAIETELGLNPSGTLADVAARLAVATNTAGEVLTGVILTAGGITKSYAAGVFTLTGSSGASAATTIDTVSGMWTVAGNSLRFTLVQPDGSTTLSSTSPARIAFTRTTAASAGWTIAEQGSSTGVTLSSGSTLNGTANQVMRIWGGAVLNGSTVEPCLWYPITSATSGANYVTFDESLLQSTTAEGGAGGADSGGVLYSTTARTNLPFRILSWCIIQNGSTAGTWSNAPSVQSTYGAGSNKTGEVVQKRELVQDQLVTTTTQLPLDNSIPQNTEGASCLSLGITPTTQANWLHVWSEGNWLNNAPADTGIALFAASSANAVAAATVIRPAAAGIPGARGTLDYFAQVIEAASQSYTVRMGPGTAAQTVEMNGGGSSNRLFNGVANSKIVIEEIFI